MLIEDLIRKTAKIIGQKIKEGRSIIDISTKTVTSDDGLLGTIFFAYSRDDIRITLHDIYSSGRYNEDTDIVIFRGSEDQLSEWITNNNFATTTLEVKVKLTVTHPISRNDEIKALIEKDISFNPVLNNGDISIVITEDKVENVNIRFRQ